VDFGYLEDVPVIRDMSLEAKPGETVALVGPTGAGKTTIINLLTRFYDIQSGKITIDGVDIRQLKMDDLRQQLGLVLQDTFLFADTVMENIRGRLALQMRMYRSTKWRMPIISSASFPKVTRRCFLNGLATSARDSASF
jgi:ABC-type bacteriocin/lantibiotic exporter with double-glycine peptidase domain